jgi:hypothetical protein
VNAERTVAHVALELRSRGQGGDRIDHHDRDRAGAHQGVGDLQRLLAGVGLRNQQLVHIDAELAGIGRIERMLRIDEGADAALLLHLGDHMQRQRGLARAFRPVDLDGPALRQPADAAEVPLDLRKGRFQSLLLVHVSPFVQPQQVVFHCLYPLFHIARGVAIATMFW